VARAQPYQGKRSSGHRPKNWEVLREYLEAGEVPGASVELTEVAEADDLFSRYALSHPDCVINTQDKDMRMVPGWHLDWLTNVMFKLGSEFRVVHNDKVWGRAWFWSQVLHGDDVDHIPGLPWYTDGSKVKTGSKKGEVKKIAVGLKADVVLTQLPKVHSDMGALLLCQGLYRSCYGDRWLVELLEQGILLWMRNDPTSSPLNVVADGNPMAALRTHEFWPAARAEILQRIAEAQVYEEAEQTGSGGGAGVLADEAGDAMRPVQAPVQGDGCGTGSLPLDGAGAGDSAPLVQCPAGEGGERGEAVRSAQPVRVPSWLRHVLAKA
jgi:DNA polymerase-1